MISVEHLECHTSTPIQFSIPFFQYICKFLVANKHEALYEHVWLAEFNEL